MEQKNQRIATGVYVLHVSIEVYLCKTLFVIELSNVTSGLTWYEGGSTLLISKNPSDTKFL